MIGLVLVTHCKLASEFKSAVEHVVGPQSQIDAIDIAPDDDMEQRRKDIVASVKNVDSGSGVIILTDLFGGTPSNLAISLMQEDRVEVIAGVNLPLLVKLASLRESADLKEASIAAREAGRKYIHVASQVLQGNA